MKLHKTIQKLSPAPGRIIPAQKRWKLCSLGEVVQSEGRRASLAALMVLPHRWMSIRLWAGGRCGKAGCMRVVCYQSDREELPGRWDVSHMRFSSLEEGL